MILWLIYHPATDLFMPSMLTGRGYTWWIPENDRYNLDRGRLTLVPPRVLISEEKARNCIEKWAGGPLDSVDTGRRVHAPINPVLGEVPLIDILDVPRFPHKRKRQMLFSDETLTESLPNNRTTKDLTPVQVDIEYARIPGELNPKRIIHPAGPFKGFDLQDWTGESFAPAVDTAIEEDSGDAGSGLY